MEALVGGVTDRWADCPGQLQVDLNKVGFSVKLPKKLDWQAGINHMQVEFGQGRVLIDPKCKFLVASLEAGMYNKNRTDFERSETLGHCDALAALSYALRMLNRENPFPQVFLSRDRYFDMRDHTPSEIHVSHALMPKQFNPSFSNNIGLKKFGSFTKR
jgi:hypothetical protein